MWQCAIVTSYCFIKCANITLYLLTTQWNLDIQYYSFDRDEPYCQYQDLDLPSRMMCAPVRCDAPGKLRKEQAQLCQTEHCKDLITTKFSEIYDNSKL